MTKFIMGLLLGLILGIGGTAAFLISAGGGDYLVVTSPRVRELETSLKQADQEREWLRGQLKNSSEVLVKLESRFIALATRFEDLGSHTATLLGAPPKPAPSASSDAAAAEPEPTAEPAPAATAEPESTESPEPTSTPETDAGTPTPTGVESPDTDSGGHDTDAASPEDW